LFAVLGIKYAVTTSQENIRYNCSAKMMVNSSPDKVISQTCKAMTTTDATRHLQGLVTHLSLTKKLANAINNKAK